MDDLLQEFLTETSEGLAILDQELVRLEQNREDPKLLDNIFRIVHTIKGTCGFLSLPKLEALAHAAEDVLGKFRDGALEVTPDAVTLILETLDTIKMMLSVIEETEAEPAGDNVDLIARLNAAAEGDFGGPATAADAEAEAELPQPEAVEDAGQKAEPAPAADDGSSDEVEAEPEIAPPAAGTAIAEAEPVRETGVAQAEDAANAGPSVAAQSIRVHVDVLENLMNMVSELVLTRNQLLQTLRTQQESEFAAPLQRLNHVTSELQEGVMMTRMQPIGNAWTKLPRVVRDLALELGKKIDLQMHGAETELDRQILELVKDPLTHMVRNSADHGIEVPAERAAAGKPETGHITLSAFHEGGHIIIEIADDGKGISVDKIKQKAVSSGMATEEDLAKLTDQQIQQFIFKAGFSTVAKVTNVSGRGVGMDVVRSNMEKIGGSIELSSVEGKGSTITIKIPLTMAIVNSLIIECAGERFAIPQISVVQLVRASGNTEHKIERINGIPVLRLRNRLLPLVSLQDLMEMNGEEKEDDDSNFIIVAKVGTYEFGIIVDRVFDTEEIVVKPVAPILRDIALFSGNTILGDGSVVMILDPNGIAAAAGEIAPTDQHDANTEAVAANERGEGERVALLLFRAGGSETPKAVPLSLVARLEEIQGETIEQSDGKPVVQYRKRLMPLVTVGEEATIKESGRQPILVFADGDRNMGLVVDEIVDIVEERLDVQLASGQTGLLGTAIIAEKATDIVDAGHYLHLAFADGLRGEQAIESRHGQRILLVDDSPFFRNLLTPLLSVAGYAVTTAESADQAMSLCEAGQDFDIILSDIEMPGKSGFEFAEAVRGNARWQNTPLVALSSHTTPGYVERGRSAGFTDYVAKFDRDALLSTLSETLATQGDAA